MSSLFRCRLASALFLLFVSVAIAGCTFCDNVETAMLNADDDVSGPAHHTQPANSWINNTRMESYLRILIEKKGRQQLGYSGYDCSPRPAADCPDCLVCARTIRGANNGECKPEGDLFIRAYVGPGTTVRAQTYWKK